MPQESLTDDLPELDNRERGCGHLDNGSAYLRSPPRSEDEGITPVFVELQPAAKWKGEDPGRSYRLVNGWSFLASTLTEDFGVREVPRAYDLEAAMQNAVDKGVYDSADDASDHEFQRHFERRCAVGWNEGTDDAEAMPAFNSHDLLMRVGKTHYDTPEDFITEVINRGLSKKIPVSRNHAPPRIEPGVTRLFLYHERARSQSYGGVFGYVYLRDIAFTEHSDGSFPDYAKDYAANDRLSLARIGEPIPAEETDDLHADLVNDYDEDDGGSEVPDDAPDLDEDEPTHDDIVEPDDEPSSISVYALEGSPNSTHLVAVTDAEETLCGRSVESIEHDATSALSCSALNRADLPGTVVDAHGDACGNCVSVLKALEDASVEQAIEVYGDE